MKKLKFNGDTYYIDAEKGDLITPTSRVKLKHLKSITEILTKLEGKKEGHALIIEREDLIKRLLDIGFTESDIHDRFDIQDDLEKQILILQGMLEDLEMMD